MEIKYTNHENETVSIKKLNSPPFKSKYVLRIHDDHPSQTIAIHLLDEGTVDWLIANLITIKQEYHYAKD
jgi:hypothetical protein